MRILFTRNNTIVSRAIRAVTREPVSHVAILVDNEYVIHNNFLGTRFEPLMEFSKHSEIYCSIEIPDSMEYMGRIFESLANKRGYDFGAMFYLAIRMLTPRHLRDILPKANLWNASNMFICTELVTYILDNKPDCLITPYQLYLQLYNTEYHNE